jgi:phospholipid transport system transporter-binding protein
MADAALSTTAPGEVALTGTVGFATAPSLWRERQRLIAAAQGGQVVVDLGEVERVDSAGLALLVALIADARAAGVALGYRRVPERLLAIARISEVDSLLTESLPRR